MKGIGARKHVLTEVLIVSSNETIREIKNAYHRLYSHKLEKGQPLIDFDRTREMVFRHSQ